MNIPIFVKYSSNYCIFGAKSVKMRIAFDLDNTLIPNGLCFETESPKHAFLARLLGCERLRVGTKTLFDDCHAKGYETWIYTSSLRSTFYIRQLFWMYGIKLHGIVNQTIHDAVVKTDNLKYLPSKYPPHFGIDYLVEDNRGIFWEGQQHHFKVLLVQPDDWYWGERIVDILEQLTAKTEAEQFISLLFFNNNLYNIKNQ
jgi:hypothetical protein